MMERPILFSTEMVNAILSGRKKQTRRICKHQFWSHLELIDVNKNKITSKIDRSVSCPYGKVGDLLWVRETHFIDRNEIDKTCNWDSVTYKADHMHRDVKRKGVKYTNKILNEMCQEGWYDKDYPDPESKIKWRSSIHMPKEAARLWLKITDIRVERLNDISNEDAIAEGLKTRINAPVNVFSKPVLTYFDYAIGMFPSFGCIKPIPSFITLWESINGKDSWKQNPWVWVIEFEILSSNKF